MYDDDCRLSQAISGDDANDELDDTGNEPNEEEAPEEDDGRDLFDQDEIRRAASEVPPDALPPLGKNNLNSRHLLTKVSPTLPCFVSRNPDHFCQRCPTLQIESAIRTGSTLFMPPSVRGWR